jgi:hypothetical protein
MAFDFGSDMLPPPRDYEQSFSQGLADITAQQRANEVSLAASAIKAKADRQNARELANAYKSQRSGSSGLGSILAGGVQSLVSGVISPLGGRIVDKLFPKA